MMCETVAAGRAPSPRRMSRALSHTENLIRICNSLELSVPIMLKSQTYKCMSLGIVLATYVKHRLPDVRLSVAWCQDIVDNIHLYLTWAALNKQQRSLWSLLREVNQDVLRQLQSDVTQARSQLLMLCDWQDWTDFDDVNHNRCYDYALRGGLGTLIAKIIYTVNRDSLCAYLGHPRLGYVRLLGRQPVPGLARPGPEPPALLLGCQRGHHGPVDMSCDVTEDALPPDDRAAHRALAEVRARRKLTFTEVTSLGAAQLTALQDGYIHRLLADLQASHALQGHYIDLVLTTDKRSMFLACPGSMIRLALRILHQILQELIHALPCRLHTITLTPDVKVILTHGGQVLDLQPVAEVERTYWITVDEDLGQRAAVTEHMTSQTISDFISSYFRVGVVAAAQFHTFPAGRLWGRVTTTSPLEDLSDQQKDGVSMMIEGQTSIDLIIDHPEIPKEPLEDRPKMGYQMEFTIAFVKYHDNMGALRFHSRTEYRHAHRALTSYSVFDGLGQPYHRYQGRTVHFLPVPWHQDAEPNTIEFRTSHHRENAGPLDLDMLREQLEQEYDVIIDDAYFLPVKEPPREPRDVQRMMDSLYTDLYNMVMRKVDRTLADKEKYFANFFYHTGLHHIYGTVESEHPTIIQAVHGLLRAESVVFLELPYSDVTVKPRCCAYRSLCRSARGLVREDELVAMAAEVNKNWTLAVREQDIVIYADDMDDLILARRFLDERLDIAQIDLRVPTCDVTALQQWLSLERDESADCVASLDRDVLRVAGTAAGCARYRDDFAEYFRRDRMVSGACEACLCDMPDCVPLALCGHLVCRQCLALLHTTAAVTSRLPVTCVAESCGRPVHLCDLEKVHDQAEGALTPLVTPATRLFVANNSSRARYCTSSDCDAVWPLTTEPSKRKCTPCDVTYCSACCRPWHEGVSCDVSSKMEALDPKLVEWMRESPKSRKLCPCCFVGIEKVDGCENVHCTNCGKSVCFTCLKYFDESGLCYSHINRGHADERVF